MKTRNGRRGLPAILSMALPSVLLGLAASAGAATFTVNSIGDDPDATPGDGTCLAANLQCTLRAAIEEANAFPGADIVDLTDRPSEIIVVATSLPAITEALTIDGADGLPTTINGGGAVRPFFVNANVTFSDIAIQDGLAAGGNGGRSHTGGAGGGAAGMGGGVFIQSGPVVFQRVDFTGNTARGGGGGGFVINPGGGGGGGGTVGDGDNSVGAIGGAGGPGGTLGAEGQGGIGGDDGIADGGAGGVFGGAGGGGGGAGGGGFGRDGGMGGFGGGGGGGGEDGGLGAAGGTFGGAGANGTANFGGGGGGGAGLGGAVFIRAGSVSFEDCSFTGNTATRGTAGDIVGNIGTSGQGKGGAIFVHVPGGASVTDFGGHAFSGNAADDDAGVDGDDDNVFGVVGLPVTVSEIVID